MRALIALLLLAIAGCSKPEPVWTSTILAGPDAVSDACNKDIQVDVPKSGPVSNDAAARWQAHTLDKFAELRKEYDGCAAWAKRQRPKK